MANLPKLPGIPAITAVQDPVVASILRPVKENLEILGKALSGDSLPNGSTITGGFNPAISNSAVATVNSDVDYTPPPIPTGFSVAGAFNNIIMNWDAPTYLNHAYTEVWRSTSNTIGSASLIGFAPGSIYTDSVASHLTYYYWIRFVSTADVAGPYNTTYGTIGQTALDPTYALSVLTDALTTSQLASALNTRIDLIDAAEDVPGSVNARVAVVQGQVNTLLNIPAYSADTTYTTGQQATYGGNLYAAKTTTTGNLPTDTTYWDLIGSYTTLGDAVAAHTTQIGNLTTGLGQEVTDRTTLATQLRGSYDGTDLSSLTEGLLYDERTARSTQDTALATSISTLSATVTTNYTTLSGAITTEETTRALETGALATSIDSIVTRLDSGGDIATAIATAQTTAETGVTNASNAQTLAESKIKTFFQETAPTATSIGDLWIDTDDDNKIYRWDNTDWIAADDLRIASTATTVATLSTTVGNNTTAISTNATSIDGIRGMYTVKIDNNGVLSGFGLSSTIIDGGEITSQFLISANQFAVIAPGRTFGQLNSVPFAVLTTAQIINGVAFDAGVYIDGASINSLSVGNAQLANLAVDDAKIASLDASKINAGFISADRIYAGSLDAKIASLDAAVIQTGFIDTARIGDASIGYAKIANDLQSTNYVAGSAGWKIDRAGTAEFNNAVLRSELIVGTNPAISGTQMTGSGAHIYSDGKLALGNDKSSIVFDGTTVSMNVPFTQNPSVLTQAATVSPNANALTVGPLTINTGGSVTISTSSTWTII